MNARRVAGAAADVIATFRSVQQRWSDPHRAYRKALQRYDRKVGQLRTTVFAAIVGAVATLVAGVAGQEYWWFTATAGAGWFGAGAYLQLRRLTPPVAPAGAYPEITRLPLLRTARPGAGTSSLGALPPVVSRLGQLQEQLIAILPAVEHLHPSAGAELRGAVEQAVPLLDGQAHRLAVLDGLRTSLAGTEAGAAAETAARDVEGRLRRGVDAYERLLAASATLLGAPDLARGADAVLAPAIEGMHAYSTGLQTAADN